MLLTLLPLLALSLSLPLASAAHLSSTVLHQNALREASFSHHHALPKFRRTLPRTGNRVDRSTIPGQATVKCTSEETWSLCNGEDCTDMGKVAPGTACVNNAMTYAASNGHNGPPPSPPSQVHKQIHAVSSPSSSVAIPKSKKKKSHSKKHGKNIKAVSPTSSSADCAVSDVSPPKKSPSHKSKAKQQASPASSSNPTPASKGVEAAQLVKISVALPRATLSVGISLNGPFSDGFATFFNQEGGTGACGKVHPDSDKIVALQIDRYGSGSNHAPDCGRTVTIRNTSNGKTVKATVADACPGCKNRNSLDLSIGAFNAIADPSTGVVPITWSFDD